MKSGLIFELKELVSAPDDIHNKQCVRKERLKCCADIVHTALAHDRVVLLANIRGWQE